MVRRMTNLPRGHRFSAVLVAAFSALLSVLSLAHTGCSAQTAAQWGPLGEAAMQVGCGLVDLVPTAGPAISAACQGFEPLVQNAVSQAQAEVAASTSSSPAAVQAKAAKEPKVALRKVVNGKAKVVGFCAASLAPSAQFHLLSDPAPVSSAPAPSASVSVVPVPSASPSVAPAASAPAPAPASSAGK